MVWSYLSGEKNYSRADRDLAEEMTALLPDLPRMARANRRFMYLAVWHLMTELGIRQFAEVGSGMPRSVHLNLHDMAQAIDPAARVLYIDNDPVVAAHYDALAGGAGTATGRVEFLAADVSNSGAILNDPVTTATLDLSQPVALMFVSVLEHFPDAIAHHSVTTLLAGLPAGSCVVLSHLTADFAPQAVGELTAAGRRHGITYLPRTRAQVARFFAGLDMQEPGVVPVLRWKPDGGATMPASQGSRRIRGSGVGYHHQAISPSGGHYWVGIGRRQLLHLDDAPVARRQ
jgi:hypothetical protein